MTNKINTELEKIDPYALKCFLFAVSKSDPKISTVMGKIIEYIILNGGFHKFIPIPHPKLAKALDIAEGTITTAQRTLKKLNIIEIKKSLRLCSYRINHDWIIPASSISKTDNPEIEIKFLIHILQKINKHERISASHRTIMYYFLSHLLPNRMEKIHHSEDMIKLLNISDTSYFVSRKLLKEEGFIEVKTARRTQEIKVIY